MSARAGVLAGAAMALWRAPALAALQTVPAPVPGPAPSPGSGVPQALLGLVLVVALIFALAWAARRLGLQRLGHSPLLKVVATAPVGTRERVVVVEVAGSWLVLGVTPNQVAALHTLPAQALPPGTAPSGDAAARMAALFSNKLREALGRTQTP